MKKGVFLENMEAASIEEWKRITLSVAHYTEYEVIRQCFLQKFSDN